jgi:chromosome partitioning protein
MPVLAVINRKGGSGKSTLATHLAAYCATSGRRVMLGDVDRQQSAQTWLKLRAAQKLPPTSVVQGWAIDPKNVLRAPAGVTHVVLDTPGGMRGFELARIVMNADVILMPLCNSVFDRESAAECFAELKTLPRVASGRCKVAAVGMRLDGRTKAAEVLAEWASKLDLPFIGVLRETQAYVRCIELGLTLFDLPRAQVQGDLAQWQPILAWLDPVLNPVPAATAAPKPAVAPPKPAVEEPVVPLKPSRPVLASVRQQPRPANPANPARPRPVLTRTEPSRRPIGDRLGELLDTLPIPRFLQRNP